MVNTEITHVNPSAQKLELVSNVVCTVEPKQIGPSNELGPFFNTLPREIRDMIFPDCLGSGYPQFMASSHAMRDEGLGQIWQKGVYRMNFGNIVGTDSDLGSVKAAPECPLPTREIANKIQNVCIRVIASVTEPPDYWSNMNLDAIKQFGGSEIRRKFCRVLLESREDVQVYIGDEVLDALKTLVGFEKVELRVVFPGDTFPRYAPVPQVGEFSHQTSMIYRRCRLHLRPALGRPHLGWDEEGHFMEFMPR